MRCPTRRRCGSMLCRVLRLVSTRARRVITTISARRSDAKVYVVCFDVMEWRVIHIRDEHDGRTEQFAHSAKHHYRPTATCCIKESERLKGDVATSPEPDALAQQSKGRTHSLELLRWFHITSFILLVKFLLSPDLL
jgi:hypothetical protein